MKMIVEWNVKVNSKLELMNKFSFDHFFMKQTNVLTLMKNFSLKNKKN